MSCVKHLLILAGANEFMSKRAMEDDKISRLFLQKKGRIILYVNMLDKDR